MKEHITQIVDTFFHNLDIPYASLEVKEQEINKFLIKIQTEYSGQYIGNNGHNLSALTHILKLIITHKIEEKIGLYIEVNDYMQTKDEHLKNFIFSKVRIVEKNGEDLKLPFYDAYTRKKIHSFVSEYGNPKIYTKSIGEGKERRLYICKKDEKLTIDLDSAGI